MSLYSKIKENSDIVLGLAFSAIVVAGGINALNFLNKNNLTTFSEFPNNKKLSVSMDNYLSIRGKSLWDYDTIQIYKCDQIVPQNTETIVESKSLEGKCSGLALIPK